MESIEAKKSFFAAYQMADIKSGQCKGKREGKKRTRGLIGKIEEEGGLCSKGVRNQTLPTMEGIPAWHQPPHEHNWRHRA
jgi:hypothetical protein